VLVAWTATGAARWTLLGLLLTTCGLLAGLGVSFPQWQMFGRSLCRVRTTEKAVALTFDDGPDPESTPALLDLLARKTTPATFFCIGERVVQHAVIARRIVAEGHQIGNHSFAHSRCTNLFRDARLRADLARAQAEIAGVTGKTPELFRPPMTLTNPRIFRVVRTLSLKVAGYSIRGYDRKNPNVRIVLDRILRRVQPGGIILLHDGGVPAERLVTLVERLIDQLHARGYQCLRLDELTTREMKP
jgi:peptidoglycan/xylan/chitin deacetylase (PgdA/CDA1 family)